MSGPMVWHGSQFKDEESFVIKLTESDVAEIDAAVASFEGKCLLRRSCERLLTKITATGLSPGHLCPETFSLPTLGPKLRLLSRRVHEEEGFFVLRGLQPWRYRRIENTIAFAGIGSYIGNRRGVQCVGGPVMSKLMQINRFRVHCAYNAPSPYL